MKILWFTWKDRTHPLAGGAEVVNEELAKRLVADGHEVILIVGSYKGARNEEMHKQGYKIIRVGNRFSVYWHAYRYYRAHLTGWADLVIDEVNTVPFFAKFYVHEPNVLFVHQLCREIWFYELPVPLSVIGYVIEPLYLRLLNDRRVITISESTKRDLERFGFTKKNVHIISEGLETAPLKELPPLRDKAKQPTVLSLGSMRSMKRTLHQIKAFEIAKQQLPDLHMDIAGDSQGLYGKKVLHAIKASRYAKDITYHGRVSQREKLRLMRQSHLIVVTSIKEGWGLIVSEAASQGTPAVVYNVDGLRDSMKKNKTGIITYSNPQSLAVGIITLLSERKLYERLRKAAWRWSKELSFDKAYREFKKVLELS